MMTRSLLIAGMALLGIGGVAASFAERKARGAQAPRKKALSSKTSFSDGRTLSGSMMSDRMRTPVQLTEFDAIPVKMSPSYIDIFGADTDSLKVEAILPTPVSPLQIESVTVSVEVDGSPHSTKYSLGDDFVEDGFTMIEAFKGYGLNAAPLADSSDAVVALRLSVADDSPFESYRIEIRYRFGSKSGSTLYFFEVRDGDPDEAGQVFASPSSSSFDPDVIARFESRILVAGPVGTIGAIAAVGTTSGSKWIVEAFHPDMVESSYGASLSLDAAIGMFLAEGLGIVVNLSDQAQYAVWDSIAQMFESNDPLLSTDDDGFGALSDASTMALLSMIAPDVQWSDATSLTPDSREGKMYAGVKLLGTLAYQCTIAGY